MDAEERAVQLYTLEYQKAAERYDNIYRSMWTIFSYLTAVSAGILTFGSDRIEPHALIFIAAIPLLFWFWTTYLPLDRYGNSAVNRLREIEGLLNEKFDAKLKHFTGAAHPRSVVAGMVRAIFNPERYSPKPLQTGWPRAFTKLRAWWERAPKLHRVFATLRALWREFHRARFAIVVVFIFLHLLVYREGKIFRNSGQALFRERPAAAAQVGHSK